MSTTPLHALHARLQSVGITGTNGKSTTTSMVAAMLAANNELALRITTVGSWLGDELLTTSVSMDAFISTMQRAVDAHVRVAAIEMTSQALAKGFAVTWPARVGVLTNFSHDHLDAHGTLENYLASKAQLFMHLPADGVAVFNRADPASALIDIVTPPSVTRLAFAIDPAPPECDHLPMSLCADRMTQTRTGCVIHLAPSRLADALGRDVHLPVIGRFNAANALAAALAADAVGCSAEAIRAGLATFTPVPGRFEILASHPLVVIDFAHSPAALEAALTSARYLIEGDAGRVITVFGAGGNRDRAKRAPMGACADRLADHVIVTSDNPRDEDPGSIADDITPVDDRRAQWHRELDRRRAIDLALSLAQPHDAVVIAGRGHETVQEAGEERRQFSDRNVTLQLCHEHMIKTRCHVTAQGGDSSSR